MPFERLPHVSPAAHRIFEDAYERTMELETPHFEAAYETHLEAQADPEYAESHEFAALSNLHHWRMSYFSAFTSAYRRAMGAWLNRQRPACRGEHAPWCSCHAGDPRPSRNLDAIPF